VLYFLFNKPATAAATTTTTPGGGQSPPANQAAGSNATSGAASTTPAFNTLAAIYQRLVQAAQAAGVTSTGVGPDSWNYYLAAVSDITPPDPLTVFPGVDRTKPMTSATYWSAMSGFLTKNMGMTGLGYVARSRYFHGGGWLA
jgi:hypothetical protein